MTTPVQFLPLTKTIAPADRAEVAAVVRSAWEEKTAVYAIGGGTRLDYGVLPTAPGVGLSLEKLNRLIDYQPGDMTITVEAGMTMLEISKILVQRHQRLPIDIVLPEKATVGGAVAVNASGPRRFAYGSMRDYVLGFTAVDGQGTIFSGGGRVLKNAAGYNIGRLMAGSLGTLGVIAQLTLMVRPLPEMSAMVACDLPDIETAEKLIAELVESPAQPTAIELALGPRQQENPVLVPISEGNAVRLIVGFEGAGVDVQWMLDNLREKWQAAGISPAMTITDAWVKSLWDWLADFPADVKISVRPGAMSKMIGSMLALDPDCSIQAHAGNGIILVNLSPKASFVDFLREELRPLVEAVGGKYIVTKNRVDAGLTCRDVWDCKSDGFAVMQSLKDRFDPGGILNPGRYIFDGEAGHE